ncbi:aldo/keto reductase [Holotrichia oblita]|uniref:Aldo/keto reductase n=1 Tax=Holotrichia oblita TaxID=644536 RepID=A0ACB9SY85_HOLOL|nr:aldo/keto reductase [Holotrichia oblita]
MAGKVPKLTLNNGLQCPALGLGTWQATPGEVGSAVKHAIDIGYRHIDCAMLYGNEKEIGEAIREKLKEGVVKREDLFIVTKLWNTFHEREQVVPACKNLWKILKLLGELDVDFPFKNAVGLDYDYVDTWKGMEECVDLGLTKSIGLSNFNSKQVQRVLDAARIKPVMNQIEVNPNINQKILIKFCRDRGIEVTAYSPFGSPSRPWAKPGDPVIHLTDPKLVAIGKKYKKTAAQIVLRYVFELGTIPIPKSTNKQRLAANLDIFNFELSSSDKAIIDQFNCNGRAVPAMELKGIAHYPFKDDEF